MSLAFFFFWFCFLIQCLLAYHQRRSPIVNAHSITAPLIRNIHTSPWQWSIVLGTPSSGNFSHFFPPQSSKARWFGCLSIICTLPAHILFVSVIRLFGFWKIRKCLFFPLDFLPVPRCWRAGWGWLKGSTRAWHTKEPICTPRRDQVLLMAVFLDRSSVARTGKKDTVLIDSKGSS